MQIIIDAIDAIVGATSIAVQVLFKILDSTIEALIRVSQRVARLIWALLQVLYYIGPFVCLTIIGSLDNIILLSIIGYTVVGFVCLLLLRELLAKTFATKEDAPQDPPIGRFGRFRINLIIILLNVAVYTYILFRVPVFRDISNRILFQFPSGLFRLL